MKCSIRMAKSTDTKEILSIYAPYVTNTGISFEYEVPDPTEFEQRITSTLNKYPFLVAEDHGRICGYAYAGVFKARAAYDWSVETTIYLAPQAMGTGVAKELYQELGKILLKQNVTNLNACIAFPNPESIAFHVKNGYTTIGHFHKCGYKNGAWYDMVWMEKTIAEHNVPPMPFIPLSELELI
ncbi:MAG: GNAT family N-acetyltransferase [Lachnospiraceae bacterium]